MRVSVELPAGWGPGRAIIAAWERAGYTVTDRRAPGSGEREMLVHGAPFDGAAEIMRATELIVPLRVPDGRRGLALGEVPDWDWPVAARTAWAAAATEAGLDWQPVHAEPGCPGLQAALVEVAGLRLALQVGRIDRRPGYAVRATDNIEGAESAASPGSRDALTSKSARRIEEI